MPAPFAWIKIPAGRVKIKDKIVSVPAFEIAKYPVTNAQFAKFIEAGGYQTREWWSSGWKLREQEFWTQPRFWNDAEFNHINQPVVGVSWFEATAFCLWLSATSGESIMLPTEAGWQRAAQGSDGRVYPWGKKWDGLRCNNNTGSNFALLKRKPFRHGCGTTAVDAYEGGGESPYGVVDMAGNIWEWCVSRNKNPRVPIGRTVRGGAWNSYDMLDFRLDHSSRGSYIAESILGNHYIGFRLSR
jgi:formylglycine-generating enzyme required for sulfatase activity